MNPLSLLGGGGFSAQSGPAVSGSRGESAVGGAFFQSGNFAIGGSSISENSIGTLALVAGGAFVLWLLLSRK